MKIRRCGTFGNDLNRKGCNFNCIAGSELVVITPDLNVYPCIFLAKKGYEIGKVVDSKIILYKEFNNKGDKCLAQEINNYHKNIVLK